LVEAQGLKSSSPVDHSERVRAVAARFKALSHAVEVPWHLLPTNAEAAGMSDDRARLSAQFAQLVMQFGPDEDGGELLTSLEHNVAALERRVLNFDASLSHPWFRSNFSAVQMVSDALLHYAGLLARSNALEALRLERIELILGPVALRVKGPALRARLSEVMPASRLEDETRTRYAAVFTQALATLQAAPALDPLLESDFFLDLAAHKVLLFKAQLDPEVMAAMLELDVEVEARVKRVTDGEARAALVAKRAALDARLREKFTVLSDVSESLSASYELEVELPPEAPAAAQPVKKPAPKKAGAALPVESTPLPLGGSFRAERRLLVAAAALVIAFAVAFVRSPEALKPMEIDARVALSPVIASAELSPPKSPKVLMGSVDHQRWARLSAQQRSAVADEISHRLSSHGLESATLVDGEQLAVQIDRGAVLVVR
jgi:hypothetical protein